MVSETNSQLHIQMAAIDTAREDSGRNSKDEASTGGSGTTATNS